MPKIIGAKSDSDVGLARNLAGIHFQCGTCMYFDNGKCRNPNPLLTDTTVGPAWCCNLYDHKGMKVIK